MILKILAHRGCWDNECEKNTIDALVKAMDCRFGFESDVRDCQGKLVLSHDMASLSAPLLDELLLRINKYNNGYCFAINVKADGLQKSLKKYIETYQLRNYFLFDMSVPQMVEYSNMGLRFFSRQSEYEKNPIMYDKAAGIWLDCFVDTSWINEELIKKHIAADKEVCIVSSDLHGRTDYKEFWRLIQRMNINFSKILLCTDHPEEARLFFKEVDINV